MAIAAGVMRREGVRVFRRLREAGHFLQRLAEDPECAGLFGPRNRWKKPVMKLDMEVLCALHRSDLLRLLSKTEEIGSPMGEGPVYLLSDVGLSWWRRQMAGTDPQQAQHQIKGQTAIDEPGRGMVTREVNLGESPLGWLRRRQGKKGTAYLTEAEADAGEQLRRDFTFARLGARTTLNWEGMLAHVDRSATGLAGQADLPVHALDARRRVERALDAVGPGLADIVVETCCHLQGLEQSERTLGWPQRSGKLVLKIALGRLAHHYNLDGRHDNKQVAYVWKADDRDSSDGIDQSV